jgi:hypothetical protein
VEVTVWTVALLSVALAAPPEEGPAAAEPALPDAGGWAHAQAVRRGAWTTGGVGAGLLIGTTGAIVVADTWGTLAVALVTVPVGTLCVTGGELAIMRGARLGAAATGTDTAALRAARWSFWGGLGSGAALMLAGGWVYQSFYSRRDGSAHVDWFFPTVNTLLYSGGAALTWGALSPWVFAEIQHRRNATTAAAGPAEPSLRVRITPTPTGLALYGRF